VRNQAIYKELTVPYFTTSTSRKITRAVLAATLAVGSAQHTLAAEPSALKAPAVACHTESFFEFLHAFIDSAEMQSRYTHLQSRTLPGTTTPNTGAVTPVAYTPSNNTLYIPLRAERQAKAINLRIEDIGETQARVLMQQDGSTAQVQYVFSKQACWTLVRIEKPA
jgi:hypothetical protein